MYIAFQKEGIAMKRKLCLFASCLIAVSLFTGCGKVADILPGRGNETDAPSSAPPSDAPSEEAAADDTAEVDALAEAHDAYISLTDDAEYAEMLSDTYDGSAVARLYHGDEVSVLSIDGDWANISLGNLTGYVPLMYISFSKPAEKEVVQAEAPETAAAAQPEAQPAANGAAPPSAQQPNIVINFLIDLDGFEYADPVSYSGYQSENRNAWCSAQSVYIYAQADTSSAKREANMLYYGDHVTVLGAVNGFYYIATDSGNGYDLHGYVGQSYITYGESPYQGEPANATHGYVSVESANVRSSPNKETNANVLFTVYKGAEFDVLSYDGYWYQINYNGTICYISHKMVEVW